MKHQYKPLSLLCLMFLTIGSMFCMNDILLPSMVEHFKLNYFQATMIQFSFYITYVIWPIPIALMIHKYGYKISLVVALFFCALGCALIVPAKMFNSYGIVLFAIFTLSTGITIVNVAANPFVVLLGDPEGAHVRMNFVQIFSRVGYAVTPVVATALIYSSAGELQFQLPYALLALLIVLIGTLIYFSGMPAMKAGKEDVFTVKGIFREVRRYPHVVFGAVAMFFYVGAEAGTAGFFIPYLQEMGFSPEEASRYLTLYYVLAAVTGLTAVMILRYIRAHVLVGIYGVGMILFYGVVIFLDTGYNEFFLAGLGLFLGVMFPTLFSLGIEEVGAFSGKASALLNFAIVGGAFFPPLQGAITDRFGVNISYLVPCFCFVMVTVYAFFFTKTPLMNRKSR
ncbi:MAG: MFS transporter [Mangrovibacterium sp.]|nr:MFS transporter [Mangrovibacterium sp.]